MILSIFDQETTTMPTMIMIKKAFLILLLAWFLVPSARASAEWFADLYAGPAFTQNKDVGVTFLGTRNEIKDVDFDTTVSFGGRVGHWFEALPYLGFALDVSHFRPDISSQSATVCVGSSCATDPRVKLDIAVTGISLDAMARWPLLQSKEIPHGQLQPYLTAGPTLVIARGSRLSTVFGAQSNRSNIDASFGVKGGAGLAWQFHPNVAIFGEYRFTHSSPSFSLRDNIFPGSPKDKVETTLNTHRAIFGLSLRFW